MVVVFERKNSTASHLFKAEFVFLNHFYGRNI